MERVTLVQSDTKLVPRGTGTMGSRSLQIGGSALYRASEEVLAKAKTLAAHLLEANVDDIVVMEGSGLGVAGVPASALSWAELAQVSKDPARLPAGMEPALAHALDFNQGDATFPFGAHIAVVEVDMETGRVTHVRHVAVDDCGRVLNPLGAKGIGEAGTIGATPAVQSAVIDALAHLGIRHIDMPLAPLRVWEAIESAKGEA
jgi:carbon-monoxide dehydrogenase large subunit